MNYFEFGFYFLKSRLLKGKKRQRYADRKLLSLQEGEDYIAEMIMSGKPFMAARYGANDLGVVKKRLAQKAYIIKELPDSNVYALCNNAGFFPADKKKIEQFADLMIDTSKELDLLAAFDWDMEEYVVKKYASNARVVKNKAIEPWYADVPWSRALKGKKVLVIHPFTETIKQQYLIREKLFDNLELLPEFELKTLKAVQTIAGETDERFSDWFEALEYMKNEAMKIDFDVAIVGCGAYGFPLAAMLKREGKCAIHMGGATQYLFGIKSKRGENHEFIKGLFNDNWVRPSEEETPKNKDLVEGGCYW